MDKLPLIDDGQEKAPASSTADLRESQRAIADFLDSMGHRRPVLLDILALCEKARSDEEVACAVDEWQKGSYSVFTAAGLCSLLLDVKALQRVDAQGSPFVMGSAEPERIVTDQGAYYRAVEPEPLLWETTLDGRQVAAHYLSGDETVRLLRDDGVYFPVYEEILRLCAEPEGTATAALSETIDGCELLQEPRLYVQHFLERLELAGAIRWSGTWMTTEQGEKALKALMSV